jgi:hypothetical protein
MSLNRNILKCEESKRSAEISLKIGEIKLLDINA